VDLQEKVAVVTGSSSGIGEATARALADAGARVVINSVTSVDAGRAVASSLPAAVYVQADVSDDRDCRRLVEASVREFGRIDILVNNAATTEVIPHHDLDAATDEIWRRLFDVNVLGTWHLTRAAVTELRKTGAGSVVNVSSLAGLRPLGSSIPYAVSKAGVNHLTRLLANVLAPEIRVNAVAPGLVDTPWTAEWHDAREAVRAMAPLKRSATPPDVAEVVLALATAGYMTGQVVAIDGGLSLR
jgi:ketoreductase RED2